VISGDDAAVRASEAEAQADETREIDEQIVWIKNDGDAVTASAFIDDETFVEVRGPKDQIERVLDLVAEHANGPVMFFGPSEFADRFDLPEGFLDGEGFLGDDFSFDDDEFPFAPFFEDGALEDFETQMRDFSECMEITVDRSGETTTVEIPDCELPTVDGLFDGEAFGNLPFDLDELLENLPKDLEGVFEESFEAS